MRVSRAHLNSRHSLTHSFTKYCDLIYGVGKSTHLDWFANALRKRGIDLLVTREPGGTPLGESLREILLSQPMHAETEALLMFAARREHVEQVIRPALQRGTWVISDRFQRCQFCLSGRGQGRAAGQTGTTGAMGTWRPAAEPDPVVRHPDRDRTAATFQ